MTPSTGLLPRDIVVAAFRQHANRADADRVVESLFAGIDLLRDLCYTRIHCDVERVFGVDSLIDPVSEIKSELTVKIEIELYLLAELAAALRDGRHVTDQTNWLADALCAYCHRRRGDATDISQRFMAYAQLSTDNRRLLFATQLERIMPEARHAPLVMYRLLPLAVAIVAAEAMEDGGAAAKRRVEQRAILPSLDDCRTCHGELLPNGQSCRECGNPLWKHRWLTSE